MKGSKLEHLALAFDNISYLMKDLFRYLQQSEEIELIKICVFHYEMVAYISIFRWKRKHV